MLSLLRALARHLPVCLLFIVVILLGTGQLDPKPIVQVLGAGAAVVAALPRR